MIASLYQPGSGFSGNQFSSKPIVGQMRLEMLEIISENADSFCQKLSFDEAPY
jgi:hypothetical protein